VGALDDPYKEALYKFNLSDPQKLASRLREELKVIEKEAVKFEGALEEAERVANQDVPEAVDVASLEEEYWRVSDALRENSGREIAALEREVARLAGEYQTLKKQYESLSPAWKPGDICPTCGQVIGEEVIEEAAKVVNAQREAIREKANEIAARGKKAQAELKALKEKIALDLQGMVARQDELLKKITAAKEQNAVRMNIFRAKEEAAEKAAMYREQLEKCKEALRQIQLELQAVAQYTAKQAEMMSETLVAHFKKASVNLFEVVKSTGEVKPVFKLMYDGKPAQVLSTSEKIKLGLEISAAVKKLAGRNWPTFVDNGESITEFEAPPGQLFVAKVVEGKRLEVICAGAQKSVA
jgi:DNA repair exonuclease SbcCD ATPase subunit